MLDSASSSRRGRPGMTCGSSSANHFLGVKILPVLICLLFLPKPTNLTGGSRPNPAATVYTACERCPKPHSPLGSVRSKRHPNSRSTPTRPYHDLSCYLTARNPLKERPDILTRLSPQKPHHKPTQKQADPAGHPLPNHPPDHPRSGREFFRRTRGTDSKRLDPVGYLQEG